MGRRSGVVALSVPPFGGCSPLFAKWGSARIMELEPGSGGIRRRTGMAEEVEATITEAEIPRVVAYLRQDIQDLRN